MFESYEDGVVGVGGNSTQQELAELQKALTAGYGDSPATQTGLGALRVESLEASLKVLTFSTKHMLAWQKVPKNPAYSTVEEYSQLTGVGSEDNTGFAPEGTLPEEDDATYARKASLVKFLGTTRQVSHPATLVRQIAGAAIDRETKNGILKVMKDAEFGMFWGNSGLKYDPTNNEGEEWDGLNTLIDVAGDVDLSNRNLEEGDIGVLAEKIYSAYGFMNEIFMAPKVLETTGRKALPKERIVLPSPTGGLQLGLSIGSFNTQYGIITPNADIFLTKGRSPKKTVPSAATSTKAPTAPASIAGGAMTGTTGKFRSSQVGDLKFQVTACNRFGESAPTTISAAVSVTSVDLAKYIPLTITNAGTVVTAPEYYNIYVTEADGSVTYLVAQVAASSQADSGTTVYNYTGYIMPNTSIAFGGQMDNDVISFKQLAPIMKMDLALVAPAYRFMVLLYGVLQLFATKKWGRIINIKDN